MRSPTAASRLGVPVLASAALLLIAGCGGASSTSGVAHLSSSRSANSDASGGGSPSKSDDGAPTQQQMVAYSQCMRSHGVPGFPEPTEGHLLIRGGGPDRGAGGLNPRSAQFQAARRACAKLLPNGGVPSAAEQAKLQESALKFSQCMRSHGVPKFPDPTFTGNAVQLKGVGRAGGIDPNAPQFKAAAKACRSALPKFPGAKGGPAEGGAVAIGGPKGG